MSTTISPWDLAADILNPPEWEATGRPPLEPHQTPPEGAWDLWILAGGRGSGKTEGAARYFARHMRRNPGHRGTIIGPTSGDVIESCVLGPSGLQSIDPEVRFIPSSPGGAKIVWPNGSEALLVGTPTPRDVDRLRAAGNRHINWWEEMAANPQLEAAWAQAEFGLRLGEHPHSIASTTPRATKAYKALVKARTTAMTRGTIFDNPYLPAQIKETLRARYEGTRLGRQELLGELLEDVEGALWTWEMIERARAIWIPDDADFTRVVIAVDPATTSGEDSDVVGIMACARRADGLGAVLGDRSIQGVSPTAWARRSVAAYDDFDADRIIGETNNGGELVETVMRTVRPTISYASVVASRGKRIRAEPVAALFEQTRVALAPDLDDLAVELTGWTPDSGESPGRMDAMVWGLTWLKLATNRPARTSVPRGRLPQ